MSSEANVDAFQHLVEVQGEPLVAETKARLVHYFRGAWPYYLEYPIEKDWAFRVHRCVWQAYVFEKYVLDQRIGSDVKVRDVANDVWNTFGLEPWVEELFNLKQEHKLKGQAKRAWYGNEGIWFFDTAENNAVPSPYYIMAQFLYGLSYARYFNPVERYRRFRVTANRPEQALRLQ